MKAETAQRILVVETGKGREESENAECYDKLYFGCIARLGHVKRIVRRGRVSLCCLARTGQGQIVTVRIKDCSW